MNTPDHADEVEALADWQGRVVPTEEGKKMTTQKKTVETCLIHREYSHQDIADGVSGSLGRFWCDGVECRVQESPQLPGAWELAVLCPVGEMESTMRKWLDGCAAGIAVARDHFLAAIEKEPTK